jgi:hypothetical protein
VKPITIFYRLGIQDLAKWQFVSNTQLPSILALFMAFSAFLPCPCPKLMTVIILPLSLANLSNEEVGSAPVDKMNIKGVL